MFNSIKSFFSISPKFVGIAGAVAIASLASMSSFSAVEANSHKGQTGDAPAGSALMRCEVRNIVGAAYFSFIVGATTDTVYLLVSGGTNPNIDDDNDSCEDAIVKFISAGWRLHTINPLPIVNTATTAHTTSISVRDYHFVSP